MKPVNSTVQTPVGTGVVQGRFSIRDVESSVRGVLVRVKVTDEVRRRMKEYACVTPRATVSALFVFSEEQVR